MTSITRKMRRASDRRNAKEWPTRQPVTVVNEDHYLVLNPTKGWQRYSNKRVWAQHRMAQMLGA